MIITNQTYVIYKLNKSLTAVAYSVCLVLLAGGCTWFDDYELPASEKSLEFPLEANRTADLYYLKSNNSSPWKIYDAFEFLEGPIGTVYADTLLVRPGTERQFFVGINKSDTIVFSEKHIELEGPVNFRDLGGLKTRDGKSVRWGMMYRSGKLTDVSESDVAKFDELFLETVVDFRTNPEVRDEPDEVPDGIEYVRLPIGDTTYTTRDFIGKLREVPSTEVMDSLILTVYTNLPTFTEQYRQFFTLISDSSKLPLVFHCTAGKDRTGIAAALFYHILGVDWDTIRADYELSNYYRQEENEEYVSQFKLYGLDPRMVESIMLNHGDQLDAIIASIEAQYGSLDMYLDKELGVNDSVANQLRKMYLFEGLE